MNDSSTVSNGRGPIDNLTTEGRICSLAIQTASGSVNQHSSLVEVSSVEQFPNVLGQHVFKRFAEVMNEGLVESYDNMSEMFKVVYFNGLSEEMRWEDLMKYLVHHEQPLPPYSKEDRDTGTALVTFAPKSQKHGRNRKKTSAVKREGAKNACPPRRAGRGEPRHSARDDEDSEMLLQCSNRKTAALEVKNLRRSTRKRKELGYTYCEETTDEDEFVDDDDDEPDYPLPPIIQVPWVDMEEEDPPKGPMKGICTSKGYKGRTKKQWASLRISASTYHRDGQKKKTDVSQGSGA